MKEYICKEELKTALLKYGFIAPDMTVGELVEDLPSADVVERKRGEWVKADDESILFTVYKCSVCETLHGSSPHNFCPNCGAKMEG